MGEEMEKTELGGLVVLAMMAEGQQPTKPEVIEQLLEYIIDKGHEQELLDYLAKEVQASA
jgi:hypothetical protein